MSPSTLQCWALGPGELLEERCFPQGPLQPHDSFPAANRFFGSNQLCLPSEVLLIPAGCAPCFAPSCVALAVFALSLPEVSALVWPLPWALPALPTGCRSSWWKFLLFLFPGNISGCLCFKGWAAEDASAVTTATSQPQLKHELRGIFHSCS